MALLPLDRRRRRALPRAEGALATLLFRARDEAWLQGPFITTVQQRGAAVIKARGASSAASAANAAIDTVRSLAVPTAAGDWFSVASVSQGDYGIDEGLVCSFPTRSDGAAAEVLADVPLNAFGQEKLGLSVAELKEERSLVSELVPA